MASSDRGTTCSRTRATPPWPQRLRSLFFYGDYKGSKNRFVFVTMEKIIEIHDSTLSQITQEDKDLILRLEPAYVIHSEGKILDDGGSGFIQNLSIVMKNCQVEETDIEPPVDLWTGFTVIDGIEHSNYIPIPLVIENEFKISFSSMSGRKFVASAHNVYIREIGEPEFIENVPKA